MSFPDVRGALTSGKDRAEALDLAEDALVAALGAFFRLRQDIPLPSPIEDGQESIPLPPIAAAKVALCTAMREQGITEAELAERLGVGKNAVRSIYATRTTALIWIESKGPSGPLDAAS